jgi:hypothetical protein
VAGPIQVGAPLGSPLGEFKMTDLAAGAHFFSRVRHDNHEAIADERFIRQLDQLRELKQFLFEEKVKFETDDLDCIDLLELNNISYSGRGRVPSVGEWRTLDAKLAKLASYLNEEMRRKIRIRELNVFFKTLPILFLGVLVISTILYIWLPWITPAESPWSLPLSLLVSFAWLIAQGGLGACAFLGTSVIVGGAQQVKGGAQPTDHRTQDGIPPPEKADVTDRNFLIIRVILGTLFAVLLGLPVGIVSLKSISNLWWGGLPPDQATLLWIFAPFVAGFSTNLVLAILGKAVAAIETFFGSPARG